MPESISRRTRAGFVVIVLAGCIAYLPSLRGGFIRDDFDLVQNNAYIRSWVNLPKFFSQDIAAGSGRYHGFFRPVQMLTYCIDYTFWKQNPVGYHITNTALHILAGLLLFRLLLLLALRPAAAFIAAFLFTLHPIHSEAVMYISGRNDPLSLLFMLLTCILYLKSLEPDTVKRIAAMGLCFAGALLSKENSCILPAFLLLYHFSFRTRPLWRRLALLIAMAAVFLVVRITVLRDTNFDISWAITTVPQRIPGFFVAVTRYLQLLLWPSDLYFRFGMPLFSLFSLRAIAGIFILAAMLVSAVLIRDKNNALCFSILWFLAALIPVANIYPSTYFMTEHWLYVPSIGFCIVVGLFSEWAFRAAGSAPCRRAARLILQGVCIAAVALCAIAGVVRTARQSGYWKDTVTFYQRTIDRQPDYAEHYFRIGEYYSSAGAPDKAIAAYVKAMSLDPADIETMGNLANLYRQAGQSGNAIVLYRKILSINRTEPLAYVNLGNALENIGDGAGAIAAYQQAVRIAPSLGIAHFNLGIAIQGTGDFAGAASSFQKVVALNPADSEAWYDLAVCAYKTGNLSDAAEYSDRSARLGRDTRTLQAALRAAMNPVH